MNELRPRITYANVVSTMALFLALGGATAFAVGQLPDRSVGERQLRPGAVTASKLRKNAVSAPKIKALAVKEGKLANGAVDTGKLANAAVTAEKLAAASVTGEKIAAGAVGGEKVDESSLGQVPTANFANAATFAESANPAAFAKVSQEGDVDSSLSKGISSANVTKGAEINIYCVTVPSFSPRGAQVTPEYNGSGGVLAQVTIGGTGSCPAPQVEVRMWNGGVSVKAPFYFATACSHLSASVRRSLAQFVPPKLRAKGCAAILPKLLAPTAAAIAREQANGDVTKVRAEGDQAFVVFRAPGAKLYQLTMAREGGAWKATTVAASVLVPDL